MKYWRKLTLSEVEQFERKAGVSLPREYRDFLMHFGDGSRDERRSLFGGYRSVRLYGISPLNQWCQPQDEEDVGFAVLRAEFDPTTQLGSLVPGAIRIGNIGCESYELLVVTGPHSGEMWRDARIDALGVRPLIRNGRTLRFDKWHRSIRRYGDRHPVVNGGTKNAQPGATDNPDSAS